VLGSVGIIVMVVADVEQTEKRGRARPDASRRVGVSVQGRDGAWGVIWGMFSEIAVVGEHSHIMLAWASSVVGRRSAADLSLLI
jgi:hypothetical protein